MFPFNDMFVFTALPIDIPDKEVVAAVDVGNTRILLDVASLPTILLSTCAGAVTAFMYKPVNAEEAGADPILLISIPPTWLPTIRPPVLEQEIPVIKDVLVVVVVDVVMSIVPLAVFDPMLFPSPLAAPPIVIPEPLVSIPVKTSALAAVGTAETEMALMVLPLMEEEG